MADAETQTRCNADAEKAREIEALREELRRAREGLERERASGERLKQRVERLEQQVAYFKKESQLREQEVRHRLGDAIVRAARPSRDTLLLPARLAGLALEGFRRRRARRHAASAAEAGRNDAGGAREAGGVEAFLICCVDEHGMEHHLRGCAIARSLRRLCPAKPVHLLSFASLLELVRPDDVLIHELPRPPRAWHGRARSRWVPRFQKSVRGIAAKHGGVMLVIDCAPPALVVADDLRSGGVSSAVAVVTAGAHSAQAPEQAATLRTYDGVVVSGEIGVHMALEECSPRDSGEPEITLVSPVVYHEASDSAPRARARGRLGLGASETLVCLYPPAADAGDWLRRVRAAIPARDGLQTRVLGPVTPGHRAPAETRAAVPGAPDEPFHGFGVDLAIAAPSYEAVHELLGAGVPTVLVPAGNAPGERRRAMAAHRRLSAVSVMRPAFVAEAIQLAFSPLVRESLRRSGPRAVPGGGADEAARSLVAMATVARDSHAGK